MQKVYQRTVYLKRGFASGKHHEVGGVLAYAAQYIVAAQ